MKNTKRKVITSIALSFIAIALVTISTLLIRASGPIVMPSGRDDDYYADLMSESNKLDNAYLDYTKVDEDSNGVDDYVVIKGFKYDDAVAYAGANASTLLPTGYVFEDDIAKLGFMFSKFVDIPDKIDGLPVEEIDFSTASTVSSFQAAASFVRALRIPKSVKRMNPQALQDFGALQYLEIPFIGTERGSSANYLMWQISGDESATTPESFPFVKMFSTYPSSSTMVGSRVLINESTSPKKYEAYDFAAGTYKDLSGNTITIGAVPSYYQVEAGTAGWYEKTTDVLNNYQYPGDLTKLVITDEYNIGNHALFQINSLEELSISRNEEYVDTSANGMKFGTRAIAYCENLRKISLPISPKVDLSYAAGLLSYDQQLTEVRLPGNRTIPESAFANDIRLETVYIPSNIAEIGTLAFENCNELEFFQTYDPEKNIDSENASGDIQLPSNLEKIGTEAFKNCYKFKRIMIGSKLKFIDYAAFMGCSEIYYMSIPFVGAHRGEAHLSGYCTDDGEKYLLHTAFGFIFGKSSSLGMQAATQVYNSAGNSATFYIPQKLKFVYITDETAVNYGAFQNMSMLTDLFINQGVGKNIAYGALNGCSGIVRLTIPDTAEKYLGYVYGVTNANVPSALKEITISNAPRVYSGMFHNLSNINKVTIEKNTLWIESSVFHNNKELTTVVVPFVGTHRGYFYDTYCHSPSWHWEDAAGTWLDSYIPGAHSVSNYIILDGLRVYYQWWWWRDINIRDSFQWIFSSNQSDATYYYQNKAQYYRDYPNSYGRWIPKNLTNVTITDDWGISNLAFDSCSSITNLTIQSASHISEGALKNLPNLTELSVPFIGYNNNPSGVDGKERTIGYIFGDYDNGHSFTNESAYDYNIPRKLAHITITGYQTAIPNYAFYNITNLQSVNITNSTISRLGTYAFAYDTKLKNVIVSNAIYTHVGDYAFYNCRNIIDITSVTPFNNLTSIGAHAFDGSGVGGMLTLSNGSEKDCTIDFASSNLVSLGAYAFANCYNIRTVELPASITTVGDHVFSGCVQLANVDVTEAKVISKYMFSGCTSLTQIDISTFDYIPEGIFQKCSNLLCTDGSIGLKFSDNIAYIGAYAFDGCESFTRFIIPYKCTSIGSYAFRGCTGLDYMTIPRETTKIAAHAWDYCDDNFYFWVYDPEEDWSTGWVDNWNCGYPVYVIGMTIESDFTYQYSIDHKGYFITGVSEGVELEGRVKFPTRYTGLPIVGIKYDESTDGLRLIKDHSAKVTAFIIPKAFYYIQEGALFVGHRTDLYLEATRAEILAMHNDKSILNFTKTWVPTDGWYYDEGNDCWFPTSIVENEFNEADLISEGLVFYRDCWNYGSTAATSTIPYYNASKLAFTYYFQNNEYTGKQITADEVVDVVLANTVVVSNAAEKYAHLYKDRNSYDNNPLDYIEEKDIAFNIDDLFNFQYSNNVVAGNNTAKITATVNSSKISQYNYVLDKMDKEYADENWYKIYLTGSNVSTFTIEKKIIYLYKQSQEMPGGSSMPICSEIPYEYTGQRWTNSEWSTSNVIGLFESFPSTSPAVTRMVGTLRTVGVDVGSGLYSSESGTDPYVIGSTGSGFEWQGTPKIYRDNVDITNNFEFRLWLNVRIVPQKVTVEWTTTSGDQATLKTVTYGTDTHEYYEYRYNGSALVRPLAHAVYYSDENGVTSLDRTNSQCRIIVADLLDSTPLDGRFPVSDTVFNANSDNLYRAIAYLDPARNDRGNYVLVDKNGVPFGEAGSLITTVVTSNMEEERQPDPLTPTCSGIITEFRIIKGLVQLSFSEAYTIPSNVDYWTMTFEGGNSSYVSGLGVGSNLKIQFRTIDDNKAKTEAIKPGSYVGDDEGGDELGFHSYKATTPTVRIVKTSSVLTDELKDYHLYRKIGDVYIDEAPYYEDLVINKVEVDIKYNDFTMIYYIGRYDNTSYSVYDTTIDGLMPGTSVRKTPGSWPYHETSEEYTKRKYFSFNVEGHWYIFYVETVEGKDDEILAGLVNYNLTYLTKDGTTTNSPTVFRDVKHRTYDSTNNNVLTEGYYFGAQASARHYNLGLSNIYLDTFKSDVVIDDTNMDKEYDREAYEVMDRITKYDTYPSPDGSIVTWTNQLDLVDIKYYSLSDLNTPLASAPVDVGEYKVVINIGETTYFNAVVNWERTFKIKPRKIIIDITGKTNKFVQSWTTDGSGARTPLDFKTINYDNDKKVGYKVYDGLYEEFEAYSEDLLALGYLLPEVINPDDGSTIYYADEFIGKFKTAGASPSSYDSKKMTWTLEWKVIDKNQTDHTKNYEVEIVGIYEIRPLQFVNDKGGEGVSAYEYYNASDSSAPVHTNTTKIDYVNPGAVTFDGSVYIPYVSASPAVTRPTDKVEVYYSTSTALNKSNYSSGSKVPYAFNLPTDGVNKIYFYVHGENYEDVAGELFLEIQRLNMDLTIPGAFDTVKNVFTYAVEFVDGMTQEFKIVVNDPTFGVTVEYMYSKDLGDTWSPWSTITPKLDDEIGLMYVKYRILDTTGRYNNEYSYNIHTYEELNESEINHIVFSVYESNTPITDDYYIKISSHEGVFDNTNNHSPVVEVKKIDTGDYVNPAIYHLVGEYDPSEGAVNNWIPGLPAEKEIGTYEYYLRIYLPNYKSYITKVETNTETGVISETPISIKIAPREFKDLTISTYNNYFDKYPHDLTVLNVSPSTNLSYEDVKQYDSDGVLITDDDGNAIKKRIYYYTDPDLSPEFKEEVTLTYSSNPNSVTSGGGWQDSLYYTNVGEYLYYIRVSGAHYKDLILSGTITIKKIGKNPDDPTPIDPEAEITFIYNTMEFEYGEFDKELIEITTKHDCSPAKRGYKFYEATKDLDGNYVLVDGKYTCDYSTQVTNPTELGVYFFSVEFKETANCYADTFGATNDSDPTKMVYFKIVPKTIQLKWTEKYYFDGEAYSPAVEAVPDDKVLIQITALDGNPGLERSEIGVYEYKVYIEDSSVDRKNYRVNPLYDPFTMAESEDYRIIEMEIVKRKITLHIDDYKYVDGKIYYRSNDPRLTYPDDNNPEFKEWQQPTILLQTDEFKHKLILTIKTSGYARDTYNTLSSSGFSLRFATYEAVVATLIPKMVQATNDFGDLLYLDPAGNVTTNADDGAPTPTPYEPYMVQEVIDGVKQWVYKYNLDGTLDTSATDLYDFDITATIKIQYPPLDIKNLLDYTVIYDGYAHTLPIFMGEKPSALYNAEIYIYDEYGEPVINAPEYILAGTYPFRVVVKKNGYEDAEETIALTILTADLKPLTTPLTEADSIYDDTNHDIYYDIAINDDSKALGYININPDALDEFYADNSDVASYHIRYYKQSEVTMDDLDELYADFNSLSPTFVNYAYEHMVDAGKYYVVIYYKAMPRQWNKLYYVEEAEILPKELRIEFNEPISVAKQYDKKPLVILLSGTTVGGSPLVTIHTEDLVGGHTIDTSANAMKNYFIQTISANAGFYGMNDFEFMNLNIKKGTSDVLYSNYKPVVTGSVSAEITKAYITADLFKVTGKTQTYTGDPVAPTVYSESDGEIIYRYVEIETDADGNPETDLSGNYIWKAVVNASGDPVLDEDGNVVYFVDGLPTDVGFYLVYVSLGEGLNYFASTVVNPDDGSIIGDGGELVAEIKITKFKTSVIWTDTTLTFNYNLQTAKATIKSESGATYSLVVYYYDEDENLVYGFMKVGKYQAYAKVDPDSPDYAKITRNFEISGLTSDFKITKKKYTINIGTETAYVTTGTFWSKEVTISMISGFPSDIAKIVGQGEAKPYVRTNSMTAGVFSFTNQFEVNLGVVIIDGNIDVTDSIEFEINGKITVRYNEVPHTVKNQEVVYKGSKYWVLQNLKALVVKNNIAVNYLFSYRVEKSDGTYYYSDNFNSDFEIEDVGVYEITYTLNPTGGGYEVTTGSITIKITPDGANVPISGTLTKPYDGASVDASKIFNQTVTTFNGKAGEYKYTYYEVLEDGTLAALPTDGDGKSIAPSDAGNYRVYLTSKEDKFNKYGLYNYTVLNEFVDFTISAMPLTLRINLSETITGAEVGAPYEVETTILESTSGTGLKSGHYLAYRLSIPKVERTTYQVNKTLYATESTYRYYDSDADKGYMTDSIGNTVIDPNFERFTEPGTTPVKYLSTSYNTTNLTTTRTDAKDSDNVWNLSWVIYDVNQGTALSTFDTDSNPLNNYLDISRNYKITLDLDIYVHFKLITGYTFNNQTGICNGNDYNGSLTVASDITTEMLGATKKLALYPAYFTDPDHISDVVTLTSVTAPGTYELDQSQFKFNLPGPHYVYYEITKEGEYEPFTGYYTVTIEKLAMPISISDEEETIFMYDSDPKYTKALNGNDYIPKLIIGGNEELVLTSTGNITYTVPDSTLVINDNIDVSKIKVQILKGAIEINPNVGAITSGEYIYNITIPAGTYFSGISIKGYSFTIQKGMIFISDKSSSITDKYQNTYSGAPLTMTNIEPTNTYYKVERQVDADGTRETLSDFKIIGTLTTASAQVGLYSGSSNVNSQKVNWLLPGEPAIYIGSIDESENYDVNINDVNMIINKNDMTVFINNTEADFDGNYHTFSVTATGVGSFYVYCYDDASGQWILKSDDDASANPKFSQIDVGTYTIKIKVVDAINESNRNFNAIEETVTLKINKAVPWVSINNVFDKDEYDGTEVLLPNNITTNSSAKNLEEYTFMYQEYNTVTNEWVDMSVYQYGIVIDEATGDPKVDDDGNPIRGWIVTQPGATDVSRPIYAGKYRMKVIIPESGNYAEGESDWKEFVIGQKKINAVWDTLTFVYDGVEHMPSAYVALSDTVSMKLKVTAVPTSSNANSALTNAGTYLATAVLDEATASAADAYSTSFDNIEYELFNRNYRVISGSLSHDYTITRKKITVTLHSSISYTGTQTDFTLGTRNMATGVFDDPGLYNYIASGLLINHTMGTLRLTKSLVGTYTKFNQEFFWVESGVLKNKAKILDNLGNDVTENYTVATNLYVFINYSDIEFTLTGNGTFTYDPTTFRFIKITVKNADADKYRITYSTSEFGTYTETAPKFKDVKEGATAGTYGSWITYYKIEKLDDYGNVDTGVTPVSNFASINIEPRNANLAFTTTLDPSRDYDGTAIKNAISFPVDCEDSSVTKYVYKYKLIAADGTESDYAISDTTGVYGPTDVGHYKVIVTVGDNSLNYKSEPIEREFYIWTRKIQIVWESTSKVFDYKVWELDITKTSNQDKVLNVAENQYFEGKLISVSANVGTYQGKDSFKWESGYTIKNAAGVDVKSNYEISVIQGQVDITKRNIKAKVTPYVGIYDGEKHGILIEIVEDEDLIKPTGVKITYRDPDTDTWGLSYVKDTVGFYNVEAMVEAENFNVLNISNSTSFNAYISIEGKEASGDFEYLVTMIYSGEVYPTPVYVGDNTGTQTVKFYNIDDIGKISANGTTATEIDQPKDAGSYCFSILIETDGVYKEIFKVFTFTILPKEIAKEDLVWEDLELVYNGENQEPKVYYLNTDGDKVYATAITNTPQKAVGEYEVIASFADTNYKILDPNNKFNIVKKPILVPPFESSMLETSYDGELKLVDQAGRVYLLAADNSVAMIVETTDIVNVINGYTVVRRDSDTYVLTANGMKKFENFKCDEITIDENGNVILKDIILDDTRILKSIDELLYPSDGELIDTLVYTIEVENNKDVFEYEKDDSGAFKYDENGNRIPLLDEFGNKIIRDHKIVVSLKDKDNYRWATPNTSEDQIFTYQRTPMEFPHPDMEINVGIDKKVFEWADDTVQVPTETVQIIDKKTKEVIATLKKDADYTVRYIQIDEVTGLETEVLEPKEIGKYYVYVDGINNYSFSHHEKKFEIVAKTPDLINVVEGVPLYIMKVDAQIVTDEYGNDSYEVRFVEDGSVERTVDNRDTYDFYLSGIYMETKVTDFVKQLANDLTYIRVFANKDATDPYTEEDLKEALVTTGTIIRLYKEAECKTISDELTCIVDGDVSLDGLVDGIDSSIIGEVIGGLKFAPGMNGGVDELSKLQYIAGMIARSEYTVSIDGVAQNIISSHVGGIDKINASCELTEAILASL